MKQAVLTITELTRLTESVYRMRLAGEGGEPVPGEIAPGQFVNLAIEGLFLRRPISVCDYEDGVLTLVFKVVGRGTEAMSRMRPGGKLNVLCGLGNGYDTAISGERPLLIGGGVGTPPLYYLAKKLAEQGKKPRVILGFNTKEEVFYEEEFRALGIPVTVTTADGSYGVKGFVTAAMSADAAGDASCFYACGPEPMLKAVCRAADCPGELSLEERMGCGFGACMGCSIMTRSGAKRVCREGPVFKREELLW